MEISPREGQLLSNLNPPLPSPGIGCGHLWGPTYLPYLSSHFDRVISAHEMGQFTGMKYALWSHIYDRIPTLNLVHSEPRALGCVSKPLSALVSPSLKWKRQLLNSETTTGSNEMKRAQ